MHGFYRVEVGLCALSLVGILACSSSKEPAADTSTEAGRDGEPSTGGVGGAPLGASGGTFGEGGAPVEAVGGEYGGPEGFEPMLVPPDASFDEAESDAASGGIEFIDPAGVLDGVTVEVRETEEDPAATDHPVFLQSYGIEPSGPLADWVYARIGLSPAREAGTNLEWWTRDDERALWFVQSLGRVTADGEHAVFALSHFTDHGVAPSALTVAPLHSDTVSGSCDDYRQASTRGVTDSEGSLHEGDCGYTRFIPLFSGLEQGDFLNAVSSSQLDPPYKITEYRDTKSKQYCARVSFTIDVQGTAEVSVLDWQHGLPASTRCVKEWNRLRKVIVNHENQHVADARAVLATAKRKLSASKPTACADSSSAAVDAVAPAIQAALNDWFASIQQDWEMRRAALDAGGDECDLDCSKCKDPCDPRLNRGDFSKCRFSGTGTSSSAGGVGSGDVTWTFGARAGELGVVLTPSGTVTQMLAGIPCTLSPDTAAIASADGELRLDYSTDPPTYSGHGATFWPATLTCNIGDGSGGGSTTGSVAWFFTEMGATFSFMPGDELSGSRTVDDLTATWSWKPEQ